MNELEQWLADVKAFNEEVAAWGTEGSRLIYKRASVGAKGCTLGLKRSKIKSMLASVKIKVEMPKEKAET